MNMRKFKQLFIPSTENFDMLLTKMSCGVNTKQ